MANPFNVRKEGSVASRFVSSTELTEAQKKREADLKAAYARMGQEVPESSLPKPDEEYDPRSLFERLQANKDAKQEKFDETWKLSNQFRGIDEGESEFLAAVAKEKAEDERRKRDAERKELEEFRKATQARESSPTIAQSASPPAPPPSTANKSATDSNKSSTTSSKRKRVGSALGIKKKKPSATTTAADSTPSKDA